MNSVRLRAWTWSSLFHGALVVYVIYGVHAAPRLLSALQGTVVTWTQPTPAPETSPSPVTAPPPDAASEAPPLPQVDEWRDCLAQQHTDLAAVEFEPETHVCLDYEPILLKGRLPVAGPSAASMSQSQQLAGPVSPCVGQFTASIPEAASPPASGVTRAAAVAQPIEVDYPEAARRRGWEGTVVLTIHVDYDGRITAVSVAQSSGHALLDRSACQAVMAAAYQPALRDGAPVASQTILTVRFVLKD